MSAELAKNLKTAPPVAEPSKLELLSPPPVEPFKKFKADLSESSEPSVQRKIIEDFWHTQYKNLHALEQELRTEIPSKLIKLEKLSDKCFESCQLLSMLDSFLTVAGHAWRDTLVRLKKQSPLKTLDCLRMTERTTQALLGFDKEKVSPKIKSQILNPETSLDPSLSHQTENDPNFDSEVAAYANTISHASLLGYKTIEPVRREREEYANQMKIISQEIFAQCFADQTLLNLSKFLVQESIERKPSLRKEIRNYLSKYKTNHYSESELCSINPIAMLALFKPEKDFVPNFTVEFQLDRDIPNQFAFIHALKTISEKKLAPFREDHGQHDFLKKVEEYCNLCKLWNKAKN